MELPVDIFDIQSAKVQHKSYQSVYTIGSIKVFGNAKRSEDNPLGLGSYLVLTGMGCDEIFRILDMHNESFGDLFRHCERKFYDKDKEVSMKHNKPIEVIYNLCKILYMGDPAVRIILHPSTYHGALPGISQWTSSGCHKDFSGQFHNFPLYQIPSKAHT